MTAHQNVRVCCCFNGLPSPTKMTAQFFWSPVITCPALSRPSNGQIGFQCLSYGCEARYTCDFGYSLAYGDQIRTCTQSGWSGTMPSCIGEDVCSAVCTCAQVARYRRAWVHLCVCVCVSERVKERVCVALEHVCKAYVPMVYHHLRPLAGSSPDPMLN